MRLTRKKNRRPLPLLKFICLATVALSFTARADTVRLSEHDEIIPTYLSGLPDSNPMFYFGRDSQGAEGRIYPYPLYDNPTNVRGKGVNP